MIETSDGSGSLVPPHDEAREIMIVSVSAAESVKTTTRMLFPPLSNENSDEEQSR